MEAKPTFVERDLASGWARTAFFWGPGILAIAFGAQLGWWGHTIAWTSGLLWLAAACFWNSARCGRVHCLFTGPFFLAMAVVALLVGFRIFSLGDSTWNLLGDTILVGGIVLCYGPELIWGRYWPQAKKEPAPQP